MKRYIHAWFCYACDCCGSRRMIGVEKGLEELCNPKLEKPSGLPHKPTPFVIKCPDCETGFMRHSATHWLSDFEEAQKGSDIFMNTKHSECGKVRFEWGGE